MFCNRTRDADNIHFLKGIISNKIRDDLTSKDDQRYRIHIGISDSGYCIRCAGAGCDKNDTRFARYLGVPLGCMRCTLFMPGKNMFDMRKIVQHIIDTNNNTARVSKECIDAFLYKAPNKNFCACHQFSLMIIVCFWRSHCFIPFIDWCCSIYFWYHTDCCCGPEVVEHIINTDG